MTELNKLEILLKSIVEDYKVDISGASLFFTNNNIEIVLSKTTNSPNCFLHYYSKNDYKNKIDIDLPTFYINKFLTQYISDNNGKNHYLLQDIELNPKITLDEVYADFIDKINNSPKHSSILLHAILRGEMAKNQQEVKSKRPKI
jgi:hypothetical protein